MIASKKEVRVSQIGSRNVIFTYEYPDWDLNLHLIMGKQNNYVIDTGLGSGSVAAIKEYLGANKKPIVVINTHWHWDHIWGNGSFPGSMIVAHKLTREIILAKWDHMLDSHDDYVWGETPDLAACLPNLVFDEGICFPEDQIRIMHTVGHTLDGISVLDEKDKVLNVGDNIGDTLEELVPELEVDETKYLESLALYRSLNADTCVSGHNVILDSEVFAKIEDALSGK